MKAIDCILCAKIGRKPPLSEVESAHRSWEHRP